MADVYNTCSDMPRVFGWDLGQIEQRLNDPSIDHVINEVKPKDLKQWIKWVYDNNGINTISWHANNPVIGGNA